MGIRINTNVTSINTHRHLSNSTTVFNKSMEKLSSGLRINRAGDDAAGLAISENLKSDIRALDQAARNAADGISLVQTAEGSLDEVCNILLRMKELAEQSLNGTLSDTDRGYLNAEYTRPQVARSTASATASSSTASSCWTAPAAPWRSRSASAPPPATAWRSTWRPTSTRSGLGLAASVDTASNASAAMDQIDDAIAAVISARGDFGAVQNRLESSIRNINMMSENLSAANSRIRDVDVAQETSTMTSYQILQQAGVAMLAQANMTTGLAMNLLERLRTRPGPAVRR